MRNADGVTAQLAWGMDNNYRCSIDVWASKGTLYAGRVFTAPAGFIPSATIKIGNDEPTTMALDADDTFKKSIEYFGSCIKDNQTRSSNYGQIRRQAELMDRFEWLSGNGF